MATVVLFGIDPMAAGQIEKALVFAQHQVHRKPSGTSPDELLKIADVVFAGCERVQYLPLLLALKKKRMHTPVIVVSPSLESPQWLDAWEAGATDYCCAPFDPKQIQWLMETALPSAA